MVAIAEQDESEQVEFREAGKSATNEQIAQCLRLSKWAFRLVMVVSCLYATDMLLGLVHIIRRM